MQKITDVGAFTSDIAAQINANFAQAGFFTSGNLIYCDPLNGYDGNSGQYPNNAVQSPTQGYNLLREGWNDVLVVMGNGLTTATARLTATFTWAKDAAHMIGVCAPSRFSQRARIAPTSTVAAFTPFFTISSSGCLFQNIAWFDGFTTGTTAQIGLNVTGSRNVFINCHIAGMGDAASAADAGSRSIVIAADENTFQHTTFGLDTIVRSALNASVEFKSGAARNSFENCLFASLAGTTASSNLALLAAAADSIDRITTFNNCTFYNAAAFSGGLASTGVAKLVAAAGGAFLFDPTCVEYGFTDWGYDAASKLQVLVSGPVPTSSTSGIAIVNT